MKNFLFIKIKLASPQKILSWTERCFKNGELIGQILKTEKKNKQKLIKSKNTNIKN